MSKKTVFERFCSKVDKSGNCWEWTASKNHKGYGQFYNGNHNTKAHRHAWVVSNGPIPDGLLVCHKCDNPGCVNPDHLFLGTHQDNERDKVSKGRHYNGDRSNVKSSRIKLTSLDVIAIRNSDLRQRDLCIQYGMSRQHISDIVNNKNWRHVK